MRWALLDCAKIHDNDVDLCGFEFKSRHVAVADKDAFRQRFFERINRIIA